MTRNQCEKMFGIGAIVGAAVFLTSIEIVFGVTVPKGSTVALLASIIPLGLAVAAVLAGFNWMIDKSSINLEIKRTKSLISVPDSRRTGVAAKAIRSSEKIGSRPAFSETNEFAVPSQSGTLAGSES